MEFVFVLPFNECEWAAKGSLTSQHSEDWNFVNKASKVLIIY